MRISLLHRPPLASLDGLSPGHLAPGGTDDVGTLVGCLVVAQSWAEPAAEKEHSLRFAKQSSRERRHRLPNIFRDRPYLRDTVSAEQHSLRFEATHWRA